MKSPAKTYKENLKDRPEMTKEAYPFFFDKYFKDPFRDNGFLDTTERITAKGVLQFIPGKIYTFQYDPLYKDALDYYDKRPIILVCGQWVASTGNTIVTGINLNFLPPIARVNTLEYYFQGTGKDLQNAYEETQKDNSVSIIKSAFQILQSITSLFNVFNRAGQIGYQFAMRNYIVDSARMRQNVIVEYDDWEWIPFLQTKEITGESLARIYSEYFKQKGVLAKKQPSLTGASGKKRKYTNK